MLYRNAGEPRGEFLGHRIGYGDAFLLCFEPAQSFVPGDAELRGILCCVVLKGLRRRLHRLRSRECRERSQEEREDSLHRRQLCLPLD
jgi:hypothetical protein